MSNIEGNKDLFDALKKWSENVEMSISKRPERKKEFVNTSGIPINRLYTPVDKTDDNYLSEIGSPENTPLPEVFNQPCTGVGTGL